MKIHSAPFSYASIRSVMLWRLMAMVDPLCSRAVVAGGRIPNTPRPIRPALNVITKS